MSENTRVIASLVIGLLGFFFCALGFNEKNVGLCILSMVLLIGAIFISTRELKK